MFSRLFAAIRRMSEAAEALAAALDGTPDTPALPAPEEPAPEPARNGRQRVKA